MITPSGQVRNYFTVDVAPEQHVKDGQGLMGAKKEGKAFHVAGTACARPLTLGSLSSKSMC